MSRSWRDDVKSAGIGFAVTGLAIVLYAYV